MPISRYKFFTKIKDKKTNKNRPHNLDQSFKNKIKNYKSLLYKIPLEERYRPDLISHKFYGNQSYYWILVIANNFFNSPEDFEFKEIIKIPDPSIINEL